MESSQSDRGWPLQLWGIPAASAREAVESIGAKELRKCESRNNFRALLSQLFEELFCRVLFAVEISVDSGRTAVTWGRLPSVVAALIVQDVSPFVSSTEKQMTIRGGK